MIILHKIIPLLNIITLIHVLFFMNDFLLSCYLGLQFKFLTLVISIPYHFGVHYATHPCHFLPIINHLESLHRQGFVHGDIRAYNMVLAYDDTDATNMCEKKAVKGWLIDFDYGGKHNSVVYPKGYKQLLADGDRPGEADEHITIMDDWKSLFGLILTKYHIFPKEEDDDSLAVKERQILRVTQLRTKIDWYYFAEPGAITNISDFNYPASLMRGYLELISTGYTILPIPSFRSDMEHCGLWNNPKRKNISSSAATGSPPKKAD